MRPARESRITRFVLTLFFLVMIGYGAYEAQGVVYGPEIMLREETYATRESLAYIEGGAKRIAELRINGRKVPVTEEGVFREPHVLAPGSNHIALEAKDARGRTTSAMQTILYLGTSTTPLPTPAVLPPDITESATSTAS